MIDPENIDLLICRLSYALNGNKLRCEITNKSLISKVLNFSLNDDYLPFMVNEQSDSNMTTILENSNGKILKYEDERMFEEEVASLRNSVNLLINAQDSDYILNINRNDNAKLSPLEARDQLVKDHVEKYQISNVLGKTQNLDSNNIYGLSVHVIESSHSGGAVNNESKLFKFYS